jgi:hypothetical protein
MEWYNYLKADDPADRVSACYTAESDITERPKQTDDQDVNETVQHSSLKYDMHGIEGWVLDVSEPSEPRFAFATSYEQMPPNVRLAFEHNQWRPEFRELNENEWTLRIDVLKVIPDTLATFLAYITAER